MDPLKRRVSQVAPELVLLGELPPPESLGETWDWEATVDIFGELRDRLESVVRAGLESGGFWQSLLDGHAEGALKATALAGSAREIVKQTWVRYYQIEPSVPVQPTLGEVFTTRAAALILAMHETLVGQGVAPKSLSANILFECIVFVA